MAYKKVQDIWRISFVLPPEAMEAFELAFDAHTDSFLCFAIEEGPQAGWWMVDAYKDGEPDLPQLKGAVAVAAAVAGIDEPPLEITHEAPRNWLAENLQTFNPIRAGRFFVHGSHFEGRAPWGSEPLMVDAGTAFGSGEHQSTYGCLLALGDLAKRNYPLQVGKGRGLDMGCGSGILALAMASHWKIPVVATDIDAESVRVTKVNAGLNGLSDYVEAFPGDGFQTRRVHEAGPYNVICANILARPLCAMAKDLAASLAPGGRVILAGLLARQEAMVLNAYRMQGLRLVRRYSLAPWVTLVLG